MAGLQRFVPSAKSHQSLGLVGVGLGPADSCARLARRQLFVSSGVRPLRKKSEERGVATKVVLNSPQSHRAPRQLAASCGCPAQATAQKRKRAADGPVVWSFEGFPGPSTAYFWGPKGHDDPPFQDGLGNYAFPHASLMNTTHSFMCALLVIGAGHSAHLGHSGTFLLTKWCSAPPRDSADIARRS